MEALVWIGTALTLAGIAGLIVCIVLAVRARRAGLEEAALRDRLRRIVVYNLGAVAVSALGLAAVLVGVILA